VEEGEIGLLLRQRRNEVAECGNNGLADAPPVTVADTEQHGIANQPTIVGAVTAETEHGFGKNEADIVLQPLAQPVAPVIIAIGVARPSADPHRSLVAQLDRSGRNIIRPEIESAAAGEVKAGVMPVTGQNAVFNRAAVKRETEVRATVIERVDAILIVHDEQWAGVGHAFGPNEMRLVKAAVPQLLNELRPDAVTLVDAFDIPDRVLCSTIGSYDGNVYERLFEAAKKSPLNQRDPFDGYEEILRPRLDVDILKHGNQPQSKL